LAYPWRADGRTLWPVNTLQLQFLISILAGWVNRGQQDIIDAHRGEDVYLYHLTTPVPVARAILLDYIREIAEARIVDGLAIRATLH
jgi:hypothetical protein